MERRRKTKVGRVVSDRMNKTVVVAVDTPRRHPLYKKMVRRVIKYKAHDEKGECKIGDVVRIEETRPEEKRLAFSHAALDVGYGTLAHPVGVVEFLREIPRQHIANVVGTAVLVLLLAGGSRESFWRNSSSATS